MQLVAVNYTTHTDRQTHNTTTHTPDRHQHILHTRTHRHRHTHTNTHMYIRIHTTPATKADLPLKHLPHYTGSTYLPLVFPALIYLPVEYPPYHRSPPPSCSCLVTHLAHLLFPPCVLVNNGWLNQVQCRVFYDKCDT